MNPILLKLVSVRQIPMPFDIHELVHEAAVLAPILIRDDPAASTPPISPAAKSQFLLYLIS